jgi:hypothetical protein
MAVFSEAFLRMRQDCDQGRENRANMIRQIRADVRELARQTGEQLALQRGTRRAEFTAMLQGLRGKIQAQAAETRQHLAEVAADLRHAGEVFGRVKPTGQRLRKS